VRCDQFRVDADKVAKEAREHRVRGSEQPAEQEQERDRDEDGTEPDHGARGAARLRDVAKRHIRKHER
jgi:hypothetical protein